MKTRTIPLGGYARGPVHFADFGGSGRPIVLVHGLGGAYTNWMAVGPALAAHGRVLAPDLIGFGRTPLAGRAPTIDTNVALLARFLDEEVREPATLVGNSMGGLISLLTAAEHPRRVSRLVLVSAALPRPRGTPVDRLVATLFTIYMTPVLGELFMKWRVGKAGPEKMVRDTLRLCGVDPKRLSPEVYATAMELARERHGHAWANQVFLHAARSLLSVNGRPRRVRSAIRKVQAPTLVIQGTVDRLVPAAVSREVARLRPDWRLEELEGVGHVPQLEIPERFVEILTGWMGEAKAAE